MPYFRVQLHGTGIRLDGASSAPPIVGFYTTRIVRAASPTEAAETTERTVAAQWANGTACARENRGSPPTLSVEWVKKDTFLGSLLFRGTGHTFYPADPSPAPESVAD